MGHSRSVEFVQGNKALTHPARRHPKQKLTWRKNGYLELPFSVVDVKDIVLWVLSFGLEMRVISHKE